MKIDDTTGATPLRQKAENLLNKKSSKGKILYSEEVLKIIKDVIRIDKDLHLFTSRRITSKIIISKVFFCKGKILYSYKMIQFL